MSERLLLNLLAMQCQENVYETARIVASTLNDLNDPAINKNYSPGDIAMIRHWLEFRGAAN